jgi:hypothetical protein
MLLQATSTVTVVLLLRSVVGRWNWKMLLHSLASLACRLLCRAANAVEWEKGPVYLYRKNSDKVNKLSINPVSVFKVSITNGVLHAVTAGGGQAKKVYDVLFVPEVEERRRHVENLLYERRRCT